MFIPNFYIAASFSKPKEGNEVNKLLMSSGPFVWLLLVP
jgi:hypothetical protein